MASPANTSYRSANSGPKRNRTLLIVLIVIAALVAVLISAELYVRHNVKQCMAQQLESELGSQVDVGSSWKPVLLQAIDKNVPYITVTSDDSSFGPAKDMHVTAKVNDIELTDKGGGTIGSSTADVDWSTAGILATIQAQPFGQLVSGVTADPTAGTLSFQVIGLAELTVRPQVWTERSTSRPLRPRSSASGCPPTWSAASWTCSATACRRSRSGCRRPR